MKQHREALHGIGVVDTSIKQPYLVLMVTLLVVVLGLLAYSTMPVNFLPDIDLPTVAITIDYPGASPQTMADQVARPVEDQLKTLSGLQHVTSVSTEGRTQFTAEFATTVTADRALQDVRDKVNAIIPMLPRDMLNPLYQKFDPNQQPIMTVSIASTSGMTPRDLRALVDNEIVPRIQQANGVGSVTVSGGHERQINVLMDLNKLTALQVLPAQLSQAIVGANANQGLGKINAGAQDVNLRVPSQIQQPEDIARLPITRTPYQIRDVAMIEDGIKEIDSYSRLNGRDAVLIDIRRQSGTNIVQVADAVQTQLDAALGAYSDLIFFIPRNQSEQVRNSVNSALDELLIAAVAALLIVLLFFRNIRNTVVTVAGLPVVMIGTFAVISLFGITINILSLLALSISVGLVIDDAIVVRENTIRQVVCGMWGWRAASHATAQVAASVLAMSLTVIAVFLPVAFTSGETPWLSCYYIESCYHAS